MNINELIPGATKLSGEENAYLEVLEGISPTAVFNLLSAWIRQRHSQGAAPASGGIIFDECNIRCPDNALFTSFSYRGDLDGWTRLIADFASHSRLRTAGFEGAVFVTSDGSRWNLPDCVISRTV